MSIWQYAVDVSHFEILVLRFRLKIRPQAVFGQDLFEGFLRDHASFPDTMLCGVRRGQPQFRSQVLNGFVGVRVIGQRGRGGWLGANHGRSGHDEFIHFLQRAWSEASAVRKHEILIAHPAGENDKTILDTHPV